MIGTPPNTSSLGGVRSLPARIGHLVRGDGFGVARMTVGEANAVNIVLGYLAGQDNPPDMVVRALETLASRAHNRLQSGWDEGAVRRLGPSLTARADSQTQRFTR
jgi:hypothetical protein